VHSLWTVHADPRGLAADRDVASRKFRLQAANRRLVEQLAAVPRAHVLDVDACIAGRSGGPLDQPKVRHMASMRLAPGVLEAVARRSAGYVAAARGRTRKCVVCDLDNTLWGGIVGEDGLHGIRLGKTAPGAEYRDLQACLRGLAERGILLAINSKNNEPDALEVLRRHQAMLLREDAFSAMRINWRPKPDNMRALADELGIGLDAMVFLDDSPK